MTAPLADLPAIVKPGDVILYPAGPKSALSSRLVVCGEIMAGLGSGLVSYSHAAVVARTPGYQYEATFPFTGRFKIDTSRPYEVWRLGDLTDLERGVVTKWCADHVGHPYNLTGVLTFDLIRLPGTYYCSQFACLAYAAAGKHPGDLIMSPDSIPQYPGAVKIYSYTPPKEA